ncbi:MAG: hypothetical protein LBS35_09425 [Synergistaceae bacterium]|jgi:hypothetical protein|nr:hypothetical protein [Synergistaceae bacterium]
MSQFEFVSSRLAIQVCIGHFPDGRERHRTFSVKDIKPDADAATLISVVRAIGSLLAYPITHARLIIKSRRVLFGDTKSSTDRKEGAAPVPETHSDTPERETAPNAAGARMKSAFTKSPESAKTAKIAAGVCSSFKTFLALFRGSCQKYPHPCQVGTR